jgi:hypothetical protein
MIFRVRDATSIVLCCRALGQQRGLEILKMPSQWLASGHPRRIEQADFDEAVRQFARNMLKPSRQVGVRLRTCYATRYKPFDSPAKNLRLSLVIERHKPSCDLQMVRK